MRRIRFIQSKAMNEVDAGHKEEGPWSIARGYSNEERMKYGVRMVFVTFNEVLAGKAFSAHERERGGGREGVYRNDTPEGRESARRKK